MRWKYRHGKENARQEAIEWQEKIQTHSTSYGCLARMQRHFEELGRKYGLLKEFRENGII